MAKENQSDARPNSDAATEAWLQQNDPEYGKKGTKRQRDSRKARLTRVKASAPNPADFPDTPEGTKAWIAASKAHHAAVLDLKEEDRTRAQKRKDQDRARVAAANARGQTVAGTGALPNLGIKATSLETAALTSPAGQDRRRDIRAAAAERRAYRVTTGDKKNTTTGRVVNPVISQPAPETPKPTGSSARSRWAGSSTARGTVTTGAEVKAKSKKQIIKKANPREPVTTEDLRRLEDIARAQDELKRPIRSAVKRQIAVTGEDLSELPMTSGSPRDEELVDSALYAEDLRKRGAKIVTGDPRQTKTHLPVTSKTVTDPETGVESVKFSEPYLGTLSPDDKVSAMTFRFPGDNKEKEHNMVTITPVESTKVMPGFSRSESERRGRGGRGIRVRNRRAVRGLSTQEAALLATIEEGTRKSITSTMSEMPFGQSLRPGSVRIQGPGALRIEEGSLDDYTQVPAFTPESNDFESSPETGAAPLSRPKGVELKPRKRTDITRPKVVKQKSGVNVTTTPLKKGAPELHLQSQGTNANISPDQFNTAWERADAARSVEDRSQSALLQERAARITREGRRLAGLREARLVAARTPGTKASAEARAYDKALRERLRGVSLKDVKGKLPPDKWFGQGMMTTLGKDNPLITTPPPATRELTVDTATNDQERDIATNVSEAKAKSPNSPVTFGMDLSGDTRSYGRQQQAARAAREAALRNLQQRHAAGAFSTGEAPAGVIPEAVRKEAAWESLRNRHFDAGATAHHNA